MVINTGLAAATYLLPRQKPILTGLQNGILIILTKVTISKRKMYRLHRVSIQKAYIYEAIEVERAGLKVQLKKTTEFKTPEEFQKKLNKSTALKTAFKALTPGRQRISSLFCCAETIYNQGIKN